MAKEIIREIIEVEEEVQQKLELEKKRGQEKIENAEKAAEEEVREEKERLDASLNKAVEEARHEAEKVIGEMLQQTNSRAELLKNMEDAKLEVVIEKHIGTILPEG